MQRISVFAASRIGNGDHYAEAAHALGREIAGRGIGVVYGGGKGGIMAVMADAALAAGGEVIGVIPRFMVEKELAHPNLTEIHVVETMHERKAMMADRSDGAVALPGGVGTLEELAEALTWNQLGIRPAPCGLLNVDGYFDRLLQFLDRVLDDGFLRPVDREGIVVESNPAALIDRMTAAAMSVEAGDGAAEG